MTTILEASKNNINILEDKITYLGMIQAVIQRMATNSFQLKGWAISLIGVIGAMTFCNKDKSIIALLFLPLVFFWFLDAYYLKQERSYRLLYKKVAASSDSVDYSMDITNLDVETGENCKLCYCDCFFSVTEAGFYIPLGVFIIVFKLLS